MAAPSCQVRTTGGSGKLIAGRWTCPDGRKRYGTRVDLPRSAKPARRLWLPPTVPAIRLRPSIRVAPTSATVSGPARSPQGQNWRPTGSRSPTPRVAVTGDEAQGHRPWDQRSRRTSAACSGQEQDGPGQGPLPPPGTVRATFAVSSRNGGTAAAAKKVVVRDWDSGR